MKIPKLVAICTAVFFISVGLSILSQDKGVGKWEELKAVTTKDLNKVFFPDKENGWIVGAGVILKTTDGGKSWEIIKEGTIQDIGFFKDVFFKDKSSGWVVGGFFYAEESFSPIVMKTKDGGAWVNVDELIKDAKKFYYVNFKEETGWIMGYPTSYKTTDGGKTWKKLDMKKGIGWFFVSKKIGFCVGDIKLLKTEDGGETFQEQDISKFLPSPENSSLTGQFFFDDNVGIAVGGITSAGNDTLIVKTEDGGEGWKVLAQLKGRGYAKKVYFVDKQNGWIITKQHPQEIWSILHTKDGGKTWEVQVEKDKAIDDFFFIDKEHAIAIGANGFILRLAPSK
ncbi:MAG: hypothetical protein A2W23_09960 [Planctomycetes bacterium RBG_16_43_13]|nr:MAG: hypothetical protein A2W23_09960 [Planctomycetes bacterium RBG_16_43_13]